jgi:hypothetical protein
MRHRVGGYTRRGAGGAKMSAMSARRALLRALRRRPRGAGAGAPPVPWGRVGDYEAVTRAGMLLLLSPEPTHPSRRVSSA